MSEKTLPERLRELNAAGMPSRCDDVYGVIHDRHGCVGAGVWCNTCTVWKDLADRIEAEYMPYPLDADGVPVKPGDSMESGGAKFVTETFVWRQPKKGIASFGCGHCLIGDGGYKADHCHLVEQPKLTKEEIDAEAKSSSVYSYWGCSTATNCDQCPSLINGEVPRKHYDVADCRQAQILDILRKERERVAGEQEVAQ